MANTSRKQQLNVLLYPREIAMLKQAATAYRSSSLNWFVGEMITAMLNPHIWPDFQRRMFTGTEQLKLALSEKVEKARKRATKPKKRRPA